MTLMTNDHRDHITSKFVFPTRELCTLLGYQQWRNFNNVIDKAKEACNNAGQSVSDHFADVSKTIPMPKGAEKDINDVMLTLLKNG